MLSDYQKYVNQTLENFASKEAESRDWLTSAVTGRPIEKVLDVGCGAGQFLLPFVEQAGTFCVGLDVAEEVGEAADGFFKDAEGAHRVAFIRAKGEKMPFADASFDVILCRVALPYMNNRAALGEIARLLKPNGVLLLKTHAPLFYVGLLRERLKTLNPKLLAYPLICLAAGFWHFLTGRQLEKGFWRGKEIFQTHSFLKKEFAKNNLKIESTLPDTNRQTPSFLIIKAGLIKLLVIAQFFSEFGLAG